MTGYRTKEEVADYSKLEELLEGIPTQELHLLGENIGNVVYFRNNARQEWVDMYTNFVQRWKETRQFIRNTTTRVEFNQLYESTPSNAVIQEGEEHSLEWYEKQLDAMANEHYTIQIFTDVEEYKFTNRSLKCLIKE